MKPDIIKERNTILTEISNRLREESHKRQIGETLEVISEHAKPGRDELFGISDNYIRVRLPFDFDGGRRICRVKVTSATSEYVAGKILGRQGLS